MNGEKPTIMHASNRKVDFKYSFEISGFEKTTGKGSIVVSEQLLEEEIKKLINAFILQKVREFLNGKIIAPDKNFSIKTSIEIIKITMQSSEESGTRDSADFWAVNRSKYLAFIAGIALVLLLFVLIFLNNSLLFPIKQ